jgi:3-dehydroquinate synthetase
VCIELPTYNVLVEPGAVGRMSSLLAPFVGKQRVAIVTDSHVDQLYARRIASQLGDARVTTIPAGEVAKTRET